MSGIYAGSNNYYTVTTDFSKYPLAGVQSVKMCLAGTYATTKVGNMATQCLDCDAAKGFYCPAASTTKAGVTCPAGYTCAGNVNDKVICPAGYYCAGGAADKVECPAGYYCKEGAAAAVMCATLNTGTSYGGNGYRSKAGSSHCCNTCDYKISALPAREPETDPSVSRVTPVRLSLSASAKNADNNVETFTIACSPDANGARWPDKTGDFPDGADNAANRVILTFGCKNA